MVKRTSTTLVLAFAATACISPESRFDEFNDRVIDAAVVEVIDGSPIEEIPDITGHFYMGMAPVIAPTEPFKVHVEHDMTYVGQDRARMDIVSQPLDHDDYVPVGNPVTTMNVMIDNAGQFEAPFAGAIDGRANSISGSALQVELILHGTIKSADLVCGTVTGVETNLDLVLDGTTFAAIRFDPATLPDNPPELLSACPADPPDAGVPDADTTPDATPDAPPDA